MATELFFRLKNNLFLMVTFRDIGILKMIAFDRVLAVYDS